VSDSAVEGYGGAGKHLLAPTPDSSIDLLPATGLGLELLVLGALALLVLGLVIGKAAQR
jgi:hypothetical protein